MSGAGGTGRDFHEPRGAQVTVVRIAFMSSSVIHVEVISINKVVLIENENLTDKQAIRGSGEKR